MPYSLLMSADGRFLLNLMEKTEKSNFFAKGAHSPKKDHMPGRDANIKWVN